MNACCQAASSRKSPTWTRRVRGVFVWIAPSAMLALAPKCPACLAAYVMLWSGLGLSLSAATYLRWSLLSLSAAALLYLIAERLHRLRVNFNYFKKGD